MCFQSDCDKCDIFLLKMCAKNGERKRMTVVKRDTYAHYIDTHDVRYKSSIPNDVDCKRRS